MPLLPASAPERAPYVAPVLEPLGRWNALTLQQSIGIFPGDIPFPADIIV